MVLEIFTKVSKVRFFWHSIIFNRYNFSTLFAYGNPEFFDAQNMGRISNGISPRVNQQWIKHFPNHSSFMGVRLDHHHILRGPYATQLPLFT